MKLPNRIQNILDRKAQLLDSLKNKFDYDILRLQATEFDLLIQSLIPKIEVKGGIIVENEANYRLLTELDTIFNKFQTIAYEKLIPSINSAVTKLANISKDYFVLSFTDLPARFDKILSEAKKLTDLRLGLSSGKVVRGGTIWSLIKGGVDNEPFKLFVSKAITSGMNMKDFIKTIKNMTVGTEETNGLFDRQFKWYAYDIYGQYDAAYNKKLADEFGMKYFIYQGGLVKDSRDFCVAHNDKVFSVEEAKEWTDWTPRESEKKGEFPAGYEIQAKNKNETPGYMNYEGYDPLVDRGGYNCRHILGYISDNLAFKLRPELKNKKQNV